jgi:hypothetical protein
MACKSCGSDNQHKFGAEINIHFPGREGVDTPTVWYSQRLWSASTAVSRSSPFQKPTWIDLQKALRRNV